LVSDEWPTEWRKGGWSQAFNANPLVAPFFGVEGPIKGRMPVFRVRVTEAHCFAEWLGGRLPQQRQWLKAAGEGDKRAGEGPFRDDAKDKGLAVGLMATGPWPVDQGKGDKSIHECRQMASNGREWTRDLADRIQGESTEIPLPNMLQARSVSLQSQSYLSEEPLKFKMDSQVMACTKSDIDVTFRIVLEQ